jgi:hypothetical protein
MKTKYFGMHIPTELWQSLKALATARNKKLYEICTAALTEYIERNK